eukprot:12826211-Alexandrium_andersonii.AAC.1
MRFGGALLAVVCIHAPRIVERSAVHSSFWARLGDVLSQQPPEAIVVRAGDATARVSHCEPWIGPCSSPVTGQCGE